MASKTALVLLADGAEEMEAVICIDVLRRAKVDVTVVGLDSNVVKCSRDVQIKPDRTIKEVKDNIHDVVVLPGGGKGAKNLAASEDVKHVLKLHHQAGNLIAAICAAPTVLAAHDIAKGKRITSYPAFRNQLERDYAYSENRVVKDGNIITSRGPGTAFEFALEIVTSLRGRETSQTISEEMLCL